MLRLALLALAGTSARQRKEKCELNLPALSTKKVPTLLSYTSSKDTLAFVSGGQLTLYGQLLPTTRINFGGAVEVLSTDATAILFFGGDLSPAYCAQPAGPSARAHQLAQGGADKE